MKRLVIILLVLVSFILSVPPVQAGTSDSVSGIQIFPADYVWNVPIDKLPKDSRSDIYINSLNGDTLRAEFGSGGWPINVVDNSAATYNFQKFTYDDVSDHGLYPIPDHPLLEGNYAPETCQGDCHMFVINRDTNYLYELFKVKKYPDGSWTASSGAIYDLSSNALRPDMWGSADAAGTPMVAGLIKYDEVASGEIKHAIRVAFPRTNNSKVWPAIAYTSPYTNGVYPPMGQRFRLKESFNTSGYPEQTRVMLNALKKYGMIVTDNAGAGRNMALAGTPDPRWNSNALSALRNVVATDFEAVDSSSMMISKTSGQAKITSPTTNKQTKVGIYQNGVWYLDSNGNGGWNAGTDKTYNFGGLRWTPLVGDWNGDGKTEVGVYQNGAWYLDNNGSGVWDTGIDKVDSFGTLGWTPLVGSWNGDATGDKIGIYKDGAWYLDNDGSGTWNTGDRANTFGTVGWTPILGNWNGDATGTKIGVYQNGAWYLDNDGSGTWNAGDRANNFGAPGWTPVVGDWNPTVAGTKIGVYKDGVWYLDWNGNGVWDGADRVYNFGAPGWTPFIGDWNGDATGTKIGVTNSQQWYLDSNGNGVWDNGIDYAYSFGAPGWTPVVGKWS